MNNFTIPDSNVTLTVGDVIELLELEPLPQEGGYFKRTYESEELIPANALPPRYQGQMLFGTAIYFLMTPENFSAMHRLDADEVYHFYYGDPVELLLLYPEGQGETFLLGQNLLQGMRPQKAVPHDVWQGSKVISGIHGFALIGTTMAPGFDWANFELGDSAALAKLYPDFADLIAERTYHHDTASSPAPAGFREQSNDHHRRRQRIGVGYSETVRTGERDGNRALQPQR